MGLFDYAATNAGIILGSTYLFASSPRAFEGMPEGGLVGVLFCAAVGAGFAVGAKREIMRGINELLIACDPEYGPLYDARTNPANEQGTDDFLRHL
jgi:hypothetical protein